MSTTTATSAPIACRPLSVDESELAVDFVTPIVQEVPIFTWMLGSRGANPGMIRMMAQLLIAVALPRGRVCGAFSDGELVGVLVWAPADRGPEGLPETTRDQLIETLRHDRDLAARMQQHQNAMAAHQPSGRYVEVLLAAIVPDQRGGDIVAKMVEPVFESAAEHNAGVTATTASLQLGAVLMRKYGAVQTDEFDVGPVTLHVYVVEPGAVELLSA